MSCSNSHVQTLMNKLFLVNSSEKSLKVRAYVAQQKHDKGVLDDISVGRADHFYFEIRKKIELKHHHFNP